MNIILDRLELINGSITEMKVDAIVNAANTTLLGGAGVDGAIHRAAGKELLEECVSLKGCPTGKAKMTKGYDLPAKYIIHTVGPVWDGGTNYEEKFLANCYKNSLIKAIRNNFKTVAFPCISTGVYDFPKEKAADIAFSEIIKFLENNTSLEKIYLVVFDEENLKIYQRRMNLLELKHK